MFEILMFLFENYMNGRAALSTDSQAIVLELEKIGFDRFEIDRALDWIEGLNQLQAAVEAGHLSPLSFRHYLPEEIERLGMDGVGFLLHIQQVGILDSITREVVIDRLMALDVREINLGRIRWVVLMALYNQPEKKVALLLLQDMIMADAFDVLH